MVLTFKLTEIKIRIDLLDDIPPKIRPSLPLMHRAIDVPLVEVYNRLMTATTYHQLAVFPLR